MSKVEEVEAMHRARQMYRMSCDGGTPGGALFGIPIADMTAAEREIAANYALNKWQTAHDDKLTLRHQLDNEIHERRSAEMQMRYKNEELDVWRRATQVASILGGVFGGMVGGITVFVANMVYG